VINENPFADAGTGMDFDAGEEPCPMGDDPGNNGELGFVKQMGEAMEPEGMETGIAEEDFYRISGCGVPIENNAKVCEECIKHG